LRSRATLQLGLALQSMKTSSLVRFAAIFGCFGATLIACSSADPEVPGFSGATSTGTVAGSADTAQAEPSVPSPTTTTTGTVTDPKTPPSSTREGARVSCQKYVACLGETSAPQTGAAVNLYGDASNCWKGSENDAIVCGQSCTRERENQGNLWGKNPSCGCESTCSRAGYTCTPSGRCVDEKEANRERLRDADACQERHPSCQRDSLRNECRGAEVKSCEEQLIRYFECGRNAGANTPCMLDRQGMVGLTGCMQEKQAYLSCIQDRP
jgi:hypothetical protein